MTDPQVSIVIRCFNEAKYIGQLLESCFAQRTNKSLEVIVVDSGSTDQTLEIVKLFPARVLHISQKDFSFGRSLNLGIDSARGRFCVIISAHCIPTSEDWLENLIKPLEASEDIVMCYGKQRGDDRSHYSEKQIFMKWYPEHSIEKTKFPFANNANSAIRRSDWATYRFNETLTGLEDLDWARYFVEKGKLLAYSATAEVIHIHEESSKQIFRRYFREALAYRQIYPRQQFRWYHFLGFSIGNVFSDVLHSIKDGVALQVFSSIIRFRLLQFWGTYKAHLSSESIDKEMQRRLFYPRNPKLLASGPPKRNRSVEQKAPQ